MTELALQPTSEELRTDSLESLVNNAYPGRVAMMGLNYQGNEGVIAYGLMGRSTGSRSRIFVDEGRGSVRTTAPGKTSEEMAATENSELIYYQATKSGEGIYVVSNGAQTVPVYESIYEGADLETAIKSAPTVNDVKLSQYEPDSPNFTPRITGVIDLRENAPTPFGLSVVRKDPDSEVAVYSTFTAPSVEALRRGVAYGVQTYSGNGDPLPSFDRAPYVYPIAGNAPEIASRLWANLNRDNRVALLVQTIDLETQELKETCIVNSPAR